jgi:hypothetical protein
MKKLQPPVVIKASWRRVFPKQCGGEQSDDAVMAIDFGSIVVVS